MVFVGRLSLFTGGLYSDVVYIAFLDGGFWSGLVGRWSLFRGSLYSIS